MKSFLLLTPGPTTVPPRVLARQSIPMIHHRTKEYQEILQRVNANLQKVFLTQHPVLTFTSSGTGAMEASITNLFSAGDTVLVFTAGKWGERYRDIAKAYGLDVKTYEKSYGERIEPAEVKAALDTYPNAKGVLVTLCETSTAVLHPIEEIAQITRSSQTLLLVDAISGLGCDPLRMDAWGVDVVVCGSQKGLMLPPGLSFVALNDRAQGAMAKSTLPRYYFNLADTLKAMKKNDTPFTPAVSLVRGLEEALLMILEEGIENVWRRHETLSGWVRNKATSSGLKLFSKAPTCALTAMVMPEGVESGQVIRTMRDTHGVVMADGQGELKGKIVRFAHMGFCSMQDVERGWAAFADAMSKTGVKVS